MENFRKEVGIDDAGSKETFIDFIVCKDNATANAISSNIYTDKIENVVREYMKNYVNRLNTPTTDDEELENRTDMLKHLERANSLIIKKDGSKYIYNEVEMKNFSEKYITTLNIRKPCKDTVKLLEKSGYIKANEIDSYTAAYDLIFWGANANNYYSADIFTITPDGKVGSVEYGIEKKYLNNTYNIEEINKANGNVKIFRAKIDNSTGTVECFEVKGDK